MESNACCTHKDTPVAAYCFECKESLCIDCNLQHKEIRPEHKPISPSGLVAEVDQKINNQLSLIGPIEKFQTEAEEIKTECEKKLAVAKQIYGDLREEMIKRMDKMAIAELGKVEKLIGKQNELKKILDSVEKRVQELKEEQVVIRDLFKKQKLEEIVVCHQKPSALKEEECGERIHRSLKDIKAEVNQIYLPLEIGFKAGLNKVVEIFEADASIRNICMTCGTKTKSELTKCDSCNLFQCGENTECSVIRCDFCHKTCCHKCIKSKENEPNYTAMFNDCKKCKRLECIECLSFCGNCKYGLCQECLPSKGNCFWCKEIKKASGMLWETTKNTVLKHAGNKWCNFYSSTLCPEYFAAIFKIVKFESGDMTGICIGISKNRREATGNYDFLGHKPDEWGYNGNQFIFNSGSQKAHGRTFKKDSVIKVIYNRDRTLSWEIDGKKADASYQNLEKEKVTASYKDIDGPFYLGVSLYYSAEVKLVEVIAL